MTTAKYKSPVGDLEWVCHDGEGKENISGDKQYLCSVVIDGDVAEEAKDTINQFWEDNKIKGVKTPKSLGYYPHKKLILGEDGQPELDEDGDKQYEETGKTVLQFKTGTTYKDGSEKIIPIFNAKGVEVNLKGKKIGNGSRGRVDGAMGTYSITGPKGKVIDGGVTLYLNGIQLSKFVEFAGGVEFDDIEGDFEGFDDGMDAIEEKDTSSTDASDKVKL